MAEGHKILSISVIWRAKEFIIEISANSFLSELGLELHRLTNVKLNTMRLLVPQSSNKGSKLLLPFSEDHSSLSLQQINIQEGKSVRMMGVFEDEIEEVSNNGKPDLRILGFEEEEKRLRQRSITRPVASLKLPQGPYTFHDFRTLQLPGIELHPPASEALRRMHMLASDPGIIAIMNKHRWQVGIMTEMAPVGYVGISPKCILGFNKNHGEEISLRLRTDDLKGFRKYESIKKTLLHELAHMVYSEHDSDFFSLDRQLNQEAADLDWTKSRSHTLSGRRQQDYHEEEYPVGEFVSAQKLGGNSNLLVNPRVSSVAAAYGRLLNASATAEKELEPDPDDSNHNTIMEVDNLGKNDRVTSGFSETGVFSEPDPDDSVAAELLLEPDPDDAEASHSVKLLVPPVSEEPDPDDSDSNKFGILKHGPDSDDSQATENSTYGGSFEIPLRSHEEPDPDDCREEDGIMVLKPDTHDIDFKGEDSVVALPFSSDNQAAEPDPDDKIGILASRESSLYGQDQELQRINESASVICGRLHNAIERLKSEVTPAEAVSVLHTLFKIIRNVIEHPDDMKFRKLRKANPVFQRNVANYKAAMEVLSVVGFHEDLVRNEIGMAEAYVVLKRNDPGLLWLVKSSLEMCIA